MWLKELTREENVRLSSAHEAADAFCNSFLFHCERMKNARYRPNEKEIKVARLNMIHALELANVRIKAALEELKDNGAL